MFMRSDWIEERFDGEKRDENSRNKFIDIAKRAKLVWNEEKCLCCCVLGTSKKRNLMLVVFQHKNTHSFLPSILNLEERRKKTFKKLCFVFSASKRERDFHCYKIINHINEIAFKKHNTERAETLKKNLSLCSVFRGVGVYCLRKWGKLFGPIWEWVKRRKESWRGSLKNAENAIKRNTNKRTHK